ncbi:MAG: hypothetical protein Q4D96_13215 [Propionibacteriaceae bacterium]|nr:hypothetical protein [Propionibacteriaceae bacterium]
MKKSRIVVAGLAVAAVAVAAPMLWNSAAKAENGPAATPAPVSTPSAESTPQVEPTPEATHEEMDVVQIVQLHAGMPAYRDRAEAEELVACLQSHGVKASLKEKTEGEPGFIFSSEGGGEPTAESSCFWERQWAAEPWSDSRLAAHNAVVEELAAFLAERDLQMEVHATKDGVKFLHRTGGEGDEYDAKVAFLESKGLAKRTGENQVSIIPTAEQQEKDRAKMQALVDHLNAQGLEAKLGKTEDGTYYLDADLDDVDVLMAKEEFEWDEASYDAKQIAYYNKKTEALAAHLRTKGFEVEIKTNRYGLKYADYGNSDEAEAAAQEFWDEEFGG